MTARYDTWEEVRPNLEVGDIVLISNHAPVSRLIRFTTQSYWSHIGMVFEVTHPDPGHQITLIVEALDHGIEIHRLRLYIEKIGKERIGFKRVPGLTHDQKMRLKKFFIDAIDVPYDFRRMIPTIIAMAAARLIGVDVSDTLFQKNVTVENFICSTFVQRAFYLAMPPQERDRVLFHNRRTANFLYMLEHCGPMDIARSPQSEWLYNPHF